MVHQLEKLAKVVLQLPDAKFKRSTQRFGKIKKKKDDLISVKAPCTSLRLVTSTVSIDIDVILAVVNNC